MPLWKFIWDDWNIAHIARHNVTPPEVEAVASGTYVLLSARMARSMMLGQTPAGRFLAIVLYPKEADRYYVISARDADRKERQLYWHWIEIGGENTV